MASLYRRPNSTHWWAKFRVSGKVVRVSTGTSKKRKAQDFLDIHAGKVAAGEPLPVKLDRITFDELRADLSAFNETTGKLRHPDDAERRLKYLDAAFRGWPAVNITSAAITAYAAKRLSEKVPVWIDRKLIEGTRAVAPATVNRELAMLRRLLRLAVRNGKLLRPPMFSMLREASPRAGFLEEPAFRTIVRHLPPVQALAATIGYQTAWRIQSEVLTLTWSRVDLNTGAIRLDPGGSKNGSARTAFLEPDTLRLLVEQRERVRSIERELKRIIPDVFVHVGKGKLQGKRIQRFRKAWYTAAAAAGHPGVLLHDLRRSGVRSLIRSGVPERVAMEISGHKTRAVFDRYNIMSEADLKDAASSRAQFGHSQGVSEMTAAR
jgi:integrase